MTTIACRYWYWFGVWMFNHWLCTQPFPEATDFLLRYPRLCTLRSYGPVLSNDCFPYVICFLIIILIYMCFIVQCILYSGEMILSNGLRLLYAASFFKCALLFLKWVL